MSGSVSARSAKPVMYSEIERLRALLDQRDLQIANQAETIRRRDAKIEELTARLQARLNLERSTKPYTHMFQVPRHEVTKFVSQYCAVHNVRTVDSMTVRRHFLGANA